MPDDSLPFAVQSVAAADVTPTIAVPEDPSAVNVSIPARDHEPVRSRNDAFAERAATRIWHEQPSAENPYIAQSARCYGYDLSALMQGCSYVDVFYLLLRGELPEPDVAELLEALMIGFIHPGPRHPAARAAMNAAVGKTDPLHILPIATGVMGGQYLGAGAVESTMRFLRKNLMSDPAAMALDLITQPENQIPGFGQIYAGIDQLSVQIAQNLLALPAAGAALRWGQVMHEQLEPHNQGWLNVGVAAAAFCDLGFQPRAGGALMQLLCAPGLLAQGLEMANKPITAMPFVKDENYVLKS